MSKDLIQHTVESTVIAQRAEDGYINATALCQACGKLPADYLRLETAKSFLIELSASMGIPIDELVIKLKNVPIEQRGTWVYPQVAINLGQWCSPEFAVLVSQWVYDWMTGKPDKPVLTEDEKILEVFQILDGRVKKLTAEKEKLEYRIEADRPMTEFGRNVYGTSSAMSVRHAAKTLNCGMGERQLFAFLRGQKVLMGNNEPYQEYMNRRWFEVRPVVVEATGELYRQTMITPKGLHGIDKLIRSKRQQGELNYD